MQPETKIIVLLNIVHHISRIVCGIDSSMELRWDPTILRLRDNSVSLCLRGILLRL